MYWIPLLLCSSSLVIWHLQSPREEGKEVDLAVNIFCWIHSTGSMSACLSMSISIHFVSLLPEILINARGNIMDSFIAFVFKHFPYLLQVLVCKRKWQNWDRKETWKQHCTITAVQFEIQFTSITWRKHRYAYCTHSRDLKKKWPFHHWEFISDGVLLLSDQPEILFLI